MTIFRCKMCGGDLEITPGSSVCECLYCGTQQTLPKLDDDRRANMYDRANHFRRNNEFDKAMSMYEKILEEDKTDSEAYWSLVLCRYGIEYVEDPTTHKRVPTVNRAQYTSVFMDENYKSAIEYADAVQKSVYEREAAAIDEIQKGILAISQQEEPFDVVVLDLGLPVLDGLSVLRRWREAGRTMPVLILTARASWHEKVEGIDAGADDYLTKPFHTEELLARLRALIRRAQGMASPLLEYGGVTLDTRSGQVTVDGQPVTLTGHEYRVLEYFMHRPGALVSRTELTEHIYAQDFDRDSNTIEVFVGRLRKKLPAGLIQTVRGMGYRLGGA